MLRVYALVSLPILAGVLFGYGISAASGALGPKFDEHGHPQILQLFNLNTFQQETFTSIGLIGALMGSFVIFRYGDRLGRRGTLMIAGGLFAVGSIVIMATPVAHKNVWMLMIGQIIYGIATGFTMHSAPLYIAEMAPTKKRGFLVSMKEQGIVTGVLLGYLMAFIVDEQDNGWRYMFILPAISGFLLTIGFYFAPETPRLLMLRQRRLHRGTYHGISMMSEEDMQLKDKYAAAREVLSYIRNGYSEIEIEEEFEDIADSLKDTSETSTSYLFDKGTRSALVIGCSMVLFQQITGQPSVLSYAPQILRSAGLGKNAELGSVIVGIFKLIMTFIAVLNADKYGRRPLLFIGISGMLCSLVFLTIAFFINLTSDGTYEFSTGWAYATVIALLVYVGSYQIGFGPVVWLLVSEIFPLHSRSRAQSLCVLVNFAANALVSWTYISLTEALTTGGAYLIYCVFCFSAIIFVRFRVPETKEKSLEEIQRMFEGQSQFQQSYRPIQID